MTVFGSMDSKYPLSQQRLRLGMVGGGRGGLVGEWHATGIRLSNRFEIVAGALSSDPVKAKESAKDWMIPTDRAYASYKDMAREEAKRSDGIEAVTICTPNDSHYEIAATFLKAGIDVILDKPMTVTMADAAALEELAAETGLFFGLTYPYVFQPMVRQARHMIASGVIGDVRQVIVEYAQDWATVIDASQVWRMDPKRVGRASTTGDIGTHAFHLLEYMTAQNVAKLRAEFHNCGSPKPLDDTAFMSVRLANGAPGTIWISQAAPGNACGLTFRAYGLKGGIEWRETDAERLRVNLLNEPEQVIVRGHGAGVLPAVERMVHLPRGHGEGMSDAWGNMYTEFALAIEQRRGLRKLPQDYLEISTAREGRRGIAFIDACVASNDAGGAWADIA
jgi:predicted dehydrogenase